jgi:hypothetical protein
MISTFMKYWLEYVKAGYDLIMEAERNTSVILDDPVELHLVHMFARSIERTDIGDTPVGVLLKKAVYFRDRTKVLEIADECLLVHSYPLRRKTWPSETYYIELGLMGYGYIDHPHMSQHNNFTLSSKVLNFMFTRSIEDPPNTDIILSVDTQH